MTSKQHRESALPFKKLNSESHLAQLKRARRVAIKALEKHCGPEMSLEEVRELLYSELQGASLGDLVIEERRQSY